jgi:DMSO/TMAO reductase YedYZ molybdopterin-dependent catalytic subunit
MPHMTKPEIDAASYRLKLTGLVNKSREFTLADLRAMPPAEIAAG